VDIKLLEAGGAYYAYDANANQIAQIDEPVYRVLSGWCEDGGGEAPEGPFDTQLASAVAEIKQAQREQHLFLPSVAKGVFCPSAEQVREAFAHGLNHLILNVTEACNLRCSYCSYGTAYPYERKHSNRHMRFETAKRAIDLLLRHSDGCESVVVGFYGGEPLLVPELIARCVQYAKALAAQMGRRIRFAITTNGTLLTREAIRLLVRERFSVLVSLDGPKEIHDRYRVSAAGDGSFQAVIAGLRRLRAEDPTYFETYVGYSCVLAPPFSLLGVRDFFENFAYSTKGPLVVSLANLADTTFYARFPGEIWTEYEQQKRQLEAEFMDQLQRGGSVDKFSTEFFRRALARWHNRVVGEVEQVAPNGICLPGQQRTFISTDGVIYPCEKLGYRLPVGDLDRGFDFDRIQALVQRYVQLCGSCPSCWTRRTCSMCFLDCVSPHQGTLHRLDAKRKDKACLVQRQIAENALRLYVTVAATRPEFLGRFRTVPCVE
jgi:uncharacterized protein